MSVSPTTSSIGVAVNVRFAPLPEIARPLSGTTFGRSEVAVIVRLPSSSSATLNGIGVLGWFAVALMSVIAEIVGA